MDGVRKVTSGNGFVVGTLKQFKNPCLFVTLDNGKSLVKVASFRDAGTAELFKTILDDVFSHIVDEGDI